MEEQTTKTNGDDKDTSLLWARIKEGSFFADTDRIAKVLRDLRNDEKETRRDRV